MNCPVYYIIHGQRSNYIKKYLTSENTVLGKQTSTVHTHPELKSLSQMYSCGNGKAPDLSQIRINLVVRADTRMAAPYYFPSCPRCRDACLCTWDFSLGCVFTQVDVCLFIVFLDTYWMLPGRAFSLVVPCKRQRIFAFWGEGETMALLGNSLVIMGSEILFGYVHRMHMTFRYANTSIKWPFRPICVQYFIGVIMSLT